MRIISLLIFIFLLSCESKPKLHSTTETIKPKEVRNSPEFEIEHIREKYFAGDADKDGKADTATVIFDRNSQDEVVCEQVNCYIEINFGKNIPAIKIDQSLGVFVQKVEDLNQDKANEIVIFSRTYQGWWEYISVWSFTDGKWISLGQTKAFIMEDKDFENRLIKEKGKYFLIGDDWDDSKGGVVERSLKVKI